MRGQKNKNFIICDKSEQAMLQQFHTGTDKSEGVLAHVRLCLRKISAQDSYYLSHASLTIVLYGNGDVSRAQARQATNQGSVQYAFSSQIDIRRASEESN